MFRYFYFEGKHITYLVHPLSVQTFNEAEKGGSLCPSSAEEWPFLHLGRHHALHVMVWGSFDISMYGTLETCGSKQISAATGVPSLVTPVPHKGL